jgi:hypothetical protein
MMELVHQLEQESKGLTTDRGLDDHGPGKGQQAFEIYVTGPFREQYDRIYAKLRQKNTARAARESGLLGLGGVVELKGNKSHKTTPQSLVNAYGLALTLTLLALTLALTLTLLTLTPTLNSNPNRNS